MHPLMKTTKRSPVDYTVAYPYDAKYNFTLGVWTTENGLLCDDDSRTPQTKKFDLETGEDQKGQ